jgi:DNA gyrase subunit A
VVKRVTTDYPARADFELISLKDGDEVVGAVELSTGTEDLVFITSDAQLLRFGAGVVRPQGRPAGGMAGIKLAARQRVTFFGVVPEGAEAIVVTSSGSSGALPGTEPGSIKVTPYSEYPAKGRATGGVRCHRFLKGEDILVLAWAGALPARAAAANGVALELPEATGRRDGSGVPAATAIARIAGPPLP